MALVPSMARLAGVLLSLFLLSTFTAARVISRDQTSPWDNKHAQLFNRQLDFETVPLLDADCVYLCDTATCGVSSCLVSRRSTSLGVYDRLSSYDGLWDNYTAAGEYSVFDKRFDDEKKKWDAKAIKEYLPGQLLVDEEGDYISANGFENIPLFIGQGSMGTVGHLRTFGTGNIQIGTGGLHGCTVITIVSTRAVYMAHYWEVYALNADDELTPSSESYKKFQRNVINTLTGKGAQDPESNADPVDWSLFNQPGDNTRIFIFSPFKNGWRQSDGKKPDQFKYPNKIQAIISTLTQKGRLEGARIIWQGYKRLMYSWNRDLEDYEGPDAALVDRTERGINLFQYDGSGNYRLFLEHMMYRNTDRATRG